MHLSHHRPTSFDHFRTSALCDASPSTPQAMYASESRPCPTMITRAHLIDVLFVIAPHSLLLDIAGPAEAFRLANQHRERRGQPPRFRLRFAGPDRDAVHLRRTVARGARAAAAATDARRPGWWWSANRPRTREQVTPAIAADRAVAERKACATRCVAADTPHRLLTICSGTLLAARAGLLGRRRCTTHHELLPRCGRWRRRRR